MIGTIDFSITGLLLSLRLFFPNPELVTDLGNKVRKDIIIFMGEHYNLMVKELTFKLKVIGSNLISQYPGFGYCFVMS